MLHAGDRQLDECGWKQGSNVQCHWKSDGDWNEGDGDSEPVRSHRVYLIMNILESGTSSSIYTADHPSLAALARRGEVATASEMHRMTCEKLGRFS